MRLKIFLLFGISVLLTAAETVTIINTTDIHANFSETYGGKTATLPQLAYAIKKESEKYKRSDLLLIDCGDIIQGSLFSAKDQGRLTIDFLNELKYDVWVPGNHDFELGIAALNQRIAQFKGDFIAANLQIGNKTFLPWKMYHRAGHRIAVIGITNHHTPEWIFGIENEGVRFIHAREALRKTIPSVMAAKPDAVLLAIHAGRFIGKRFNDPYNLQKLLQPYPQIALVLGGHSHETVPGTLIGPNVWFVQAGAKASGFIRVQITFDGKKKPHLESAFIKVDPNGPASEPGSKKIAQERKAENRIIARKMPRTGKRSAKTEIAALYAEAIRKALPDVQIVFHGLLSKFEPKPGLPLREWGLFRLCPFENTVVTAMISPDECKAILREQTAEKGRSGMYQYAFGVRFGPHKELMLPDGSLWTTGRRKAAFNSYAAAGGGMRFPVMKSILKKKETAAQNTGLKIRDLLENKLKGPAR